VCQEDFYHDWACLFELLALSWANIPYKGSFSYTIHFTLMWDYVGWVAYTPEKQSQIILALLLDTIIFATLGNNYYLHY